MPTAPPSAAAVSPITPGMCSYDYANKCPISVIGPGGMCVHSCSVPSVETRSVAVNTPQFHEPSPSYNWKELSRASGGHSLLLGNEEEELQAMLRELLAAFPTQTTKSEYKNL